MTLARTGSMRLFLALVIVANCKAGSHNGDVAECDEACQAQAQPDHCVSTQDYFRDYSWPIVFSDCVNCHVPNGPADGTRFVLDDGDINRSFEVVKEVSALQDNGVPLLLLKPSEAIPHQGGKRLDDGSQKVAVLEETLKQIAMPVSCPNDTPPPTPIVEGLIQLDAYGTLRKAALQLSGRLPTSSEIAAVDTGGIDALDPILDDLMTGPNFEERMREMLNDMLLTDGFRPDNTYSASTQALFSAGYVIPYDVADGGGVPGAGISADPDYAYPYHPLGTKQATALAREPLEFFVRAIKNDHPMSEILTAKYRLLNGWSASFLGLPYKGFAPIDINNAPNPDEFVEYASVPSLNERGMPGEYAGILTTTAFLARYPTTPTNFNRKRGRMTYKFFLNYDIMKLAPRIDASAVDLTQNPTLNNTQCTGCHSQIDPLAGAYMNWSSCDDRTTEMHWKKEDKANICQAEGWRPKTEMFPPGTGAGDANTLAVADRPKALEHLAAAIVAKPGFAESMVNVVYVGLMNRPLLNRPTDAAVPGYANLLAAYDAEHAELARLAKAFADNGLHLKPIIKEIVRGPFFRGASAEVDGRLELIAVGGGTMTTPEVLDRKIRAIFGRPWDLLSRDRGYGYDTMGQERLLRRMDFKTLGGGIDSTFAGIKTRARLPNAVIAGIAEHMALDMACRHTARDFELSKGQRRLFPLVEKDSGEADIIQNIRYLHERIVGERLEANDPEIQATYKLFTDTRADMAAKSVSANLQTPCSVEYDLDTGDALAGHTTTDPTYVIRAWQAVVTYLLLDYRFVMEI